MGLDRQYVECAVGLNFQKVAAEMAELSNETDDDAPQRQRQDFARQYLEKLVNIEVPVPVPTPEDSRKLLTADKQDDAPREDELAKLRAQFEVARQAMGVAAAIAVLVFAFYLGGNILSPPPSEPVIALIEAAPITGSASTASTGETIVPDPTTPTRPPRQISSTPPAKLPPSRPPNKLQMPENTSACGHYSPRSSFFGWESAGYSLAGPISLCLTQRDLNPRFRFGIQWFRKSKIRRAPSSGISTGSATWPCGSARARHPTHCGSDS